MRHVSWTCGRGAGGAMVGTIMVLLGCSRGAEKSAPPPDDAATPFVLDDPELVARNNRGVGQMGRFEYGPAHDTFAALVAANPGWLDAKVNLAIATFNRQEDGDEERGLALLEDVLAADPAHLRAHYCAGVLKQRRGDLEPALAHFRVVAEADPDDPFAVYAMAQCLEGSDDEAALARYRRTIALDPYLRSAYYRAFQLLQRLGRPDEARIYFEDFQRLDKNPRAHLVELKYTRMGRKAEAITADLAGASAAPAPLPAGLPFAPVEPLLTGAAARAWNADPPAGGFGLSAGDLDGDGAVDLFVADALREGAVRNAILLGGEADAFALAPDHPLAVVSDVRAALWGDVDNDGRLDAYLCRRGANQLWRQEGPGEWTDVTAAAGVGGGAADTVDGLLVDADHDGDLDVFCVNADGPNELFSNNLDGTFRPLGAERGLAGDGRPSRQVVGADVDRDRDTDLIVINETPPHELYLNDRLWQYRPLTPAFAGLAIDRAVAADLDADGGIELYAAAPDGSVHVFSSFVATEDGGDFADEHHVPAPAGPAPPGTAQLAVADVDGDGRPELLTSSADGWVALDAETWSPRFVADAGGSLAWTPLVADAGAGPWIVGMPAGGPPLAWRDGPGRHRFAAFTFSGRVKQADSMRSNAAGIGTLAAFRIGSTWVVRDTLGGHSGPGQSLQPLAVGLGGTRGVDFVAIDWSDGVFQSELDLAAGALHEITETQRQLSSCPVLFAWNGASFAFVSDLLGVGGLGYLVAPGEYAPPRPWERFLLPPGALAGRDGRYALKLGEPMEEACYLDAATLEVIDVPPGWHVVIDERMSILGPEPTGEALFYRVERRPARVVNDRGADVRDAVREADAVAAPVGALDRRFIGRLARDHVLTLEFDEPLDAGPGAPVLVVDGWVEYPYSQTMFAAWQAAADYRAPTLEARDTDGPWRVVYEQFGYPAGMPRRMALPLPALPPGTRALRLSTNQEVYWDRLAVAFVMPCPEARRRELTPAAARLAETGFARRTTGAQRLPHYDYDRRAPLWDARHQAGWYTGFGPVTDLVTATDDALAIFGPGEEVHLEFAAPPGPPAAWSRAFVLGVTGWCKDMDLFTRSGETVEPLPGRGASTERRRELHHRYNTRYRSGR